MTLRRDPVRALGDLIDGRFVRPSAPHESLACVSPADLEDTVMHVPFSARHAALALEAARRAQPSWRRTPVADRAKCLRAYAEAVRTRREGLAVAIARAVGKPLWEARAEVDAVIAKVDISLGAGLELIAPRELPELNARVRYRPIGVAVVLGPFNFPAHLPNGHLVPALATGNTVVFKPSERAPEVGQIMAECFLAAGFPDGVVNVVQGDARVASALVNDARADAVMFTGSTSVGASILADSARFPGRMLALEMGGKNSAIVFDDADLDHAVREIAFAAYVTAGQRCTATSRVLCARGVIDELTERLAYVARETRVGAPDGDDVFLGPVISAQSLERVLTALGTRERDALVAVRRAEVDGVRGHYLAPSLYRARADDELFACEELFGPVLSIECVDDETAAIASANRPRYGLAASVFTADRARYERVALDLDAGVCNWNRGTVGSASRLPFGGVKDSGNHRAAGLFSSLYCVDPVGEILIADPPASAAPSPGLRLRP